jgi:hypothetical protein
LLKTTGYNMAQYKYTITIREPSGRDLIIPFVTEAGDTNEGERIARALYSGQRILSLTHGGRIRETSSYQIPVSNSNGKLFGWSDLIIWSLIIGVSLYFWFFDLFPIEF